MNSRGHVGGEEDSRPACRAEVVRHSELAFRDSNAIDLESVVDLRLAGDLQYLIAGVPGRDCTSATTSLLAEVAMTGVDPLWFSAHSDNHPTTSASRRSLRHAHRMPDPVLSLRAPNGSYVLRSSCGCQEQDAHDQDTDDEPDRHADRHTGSARRDVAHHTTGSL